MWLVLIALAALTAFAGAQRCRARLKVGNIVVLDVVVVPMREVEGKYR